jgi:hypothetical protein
MPFTGISQHFWCEGVDQSGQLWFVLGFVDGCVSGTVDAYINFVGGETHFNSHFVADVQSVDISEEPLMARIV